MATSPEVGAGNVAITLDGKELVLVPTVNAALAISKMTGGLRGAVDASMRMDLDTITRVIQLGLGPKVVRELGGSDRLPSLVFEAGLLDSSGAVLAKCVEYITILSNGGRPIEEDNGDKEDKENPR